MEYSIRQMSKLSGVSTRTLRYYHEIGLLTPARINSSGYRIYGSEQADLLQQILFYRELEFPLDAIRKILSSGDFDPARALRAHRSLLIQKRKKLDALIETVDNTLRAEKGRIPMRDEEKFEGFKETLIRENEEKYGSELRARYGNEAVEASNRKVKGLSQAQYEEAEALAKKVIELFLAAFETGDPASPEAREAAECHRRWLSFYWPEYSGEKHAGLAQMYVDDPRFTAYYDQYRPGLTVFLRDAILAYTGQSA